MAATHKLYYFDARGRAEIIRLTFAATGTKYEDIRFSKEEWGSKYKAMSPSGQAPFLECPGCVKTQSQAIARVIARKHNLMGETDQDYYQVERIIGHVDDIFVEVMKLVFTPEAQREALKKELATTKGPEMIKVLLKYMKESGSEFAAGKKLSLADLAIVVVSDVMKGSLPDVYKQFPELEKHYQHVLKSNEGVAKHIKTRPVTTM